MSIDRLNANYRRRGLNVWDMIDDINTYKHRAKTATSVRKAKKFRRRSELLFMGAEMRMRKVFRGLVEAKAALG